MASEPTNWALKIDKVAYTVAGLVAGFFIDKWLSTTPAFTLIMFVLGIAAGMLQLVRDIRKLEQQERHEDRR